VKNDTVVVPFTSAQCEHGGCKACVYTSKRLRMKLLLCHLQVLSVSMEAVKLVYILVRGEE
jgi:hypothetical protein